VLRKGRKPNQTSIWTFPRKTWLWSTVVPTSPTTILLHRDPPLVPRFRPLKGVRPIQASATPPEWRGGRGRRPVRTACAISRCRRRGWCRGWRRVICRRSRRALYRCFRLSRKKRFRRGIRVRGVRRVVRRSSWAHDNGPAPSWPSSKYSTHKNRPCSRCLSYNDKAKKSAKTKQSANAPTKNCLTSATASKSKPWWWPHSSMPKDYKTPVGWLW